MNKIKEKLAIFDLDGTLYDTGDVNYYSYLEALLPYSVALDKEYFEKECNGRHYTEFLPIVMKSTDNIECVHSRKKQFYEKYLDKARPNIHLFEMIKCMTKDYHLAVVTTASRKNTMEILRHFGHDTLFEFIVTQEDVTKAKPDPQGFRLAMEHFAISSEKTVIFEDSKVGIEAARAVGATVLVVNMF